MIFVYNIPIPMSLFIVGSCSRLTRGIINTLVQRNLYGKIIVGDLFPTYAAFERYYCLRQELAEIKSGSTLVKPVKLLEHNDIHLWSKRADQILFVTHDYYLNVTSKTRLMRMLAEAAKQVPKLRCRNLTCFMSRQQNTTTTTTTSQRKSTRRQCRMFRNSAHRQVSYAATLLLVLSSQTSLPARRNGGTTFR